MAPPKVPSTEAILRRDKIFIEMVINHSGHKSREELGECVAFHPITCVAPDTTIQSTNSCFGGHQIFAPEPISADSFSGDRCSYCFSNLAQVFQLNVTELMSTLHQVGQGDSPAMDALRRLKTTTVIDYWHPDQRPESPPPAEASDILGGGGAPGTETLLVVRMCPSFRQHLFDAIEVPSSEIGSDSEGEKDAPKEEEVEFPVNTNEASVDLEYYSGSSWKADVIEVPALATAKLYGLDDDKTNTVDWVIGVSEETDKQGKTREVPETVPVKVNTYAAWPARAVTALLPFNDTPETHDELVTVGGRQVGPIDRILGVPVALRCQHRHNIMDAASECGSTQCITIAQVYGANLRLEEPAAVERVSDKGKKESYVTPAVPMTIIVNFCQQCGHLTLHYKKMPLEEEEPESNACLVVDVD